MPYEYASPFSGALNLSLGCGRNFLAGVLVVLQRLLALGCLALEEVRRRNRGLRLIGAVGNLLDAVLIPAVVFPRHGFLVRPAPHNRGKLGRR